MELEGHVVRATEMGFAQFAASESYLFFLTQRKYWPKDKPIALATR